MSCEDSGAPPLPPHHPTAPEVPWTPPRHSHDVKTRGETSPLESLRSPRTSSQLKPLITFNAKEVD